MPYTIILFTKSEFIASGNLYDSTPTSFLYIVHTLVPIHIENFIIQFIRFIIQLIQNVKGVPTTREKKTRKSLRADF